MRFSTISLLALPILAAASQPDTPIEQAKAQAQYWFSKIQSYIPNPSKESPTEAAAAAVGEAKVETLTLDNWESTIRGSVAPLGNTRAEWWVLATGGNKTCFGLCNGIDKGFNASAAIFALDPTAPHMAIMNCDDQPVLCNSWGAGPPYLWTMDVGAPGTPVIIRTMALNTSTTDVSTFTELHATKSYLEKAPFEGYFHPFDGQLAQYGLAVPVGYVLWFFTVIPSWAFMIGVSFLSRTMMSRRAGGPRAAAAAPPRPRGAAPAGDGVTY